MRKIESIWTKFERGVGFSYGWAALALKKPPPLVPSILMATWEAAGPWAMIWESPALPRAEAEAASIGVAFT